jgi:hypothetical protein
VCPPARAVWRSRGEDVTPRRAMMRARLRRRLGEGRGDRGVGPGVGTARGAR